MLKSHSELKTCWHRIFRSQYNAILMRWAAWVNASDRDGSECGMNLSNSLFLCSGGRKWSIIGNNVHVPHLYLVTVLQFTRKMFQGLTRPLLSLVHHRAIYSPLALFELQASSLFLRVSWNSVQYNTILFVSKMQTKTHATYSKYRTVCLMLYCIVLVCISYQCITFVYICVIVGKLVLLFC